MILTLHLLIGATIGLFIPNYFWVFIISLFVHFVLDSIPHVEYNVENLQEQRPKDISYLVSLIKVFADFCVGVGIVFLLLWNSPYLSYAIIGMIGSVVPDGLLFVYFLTRASFLDKFAYFHSQVVHFHKNKKISLFWRIATQIGVGLTAIFILGSS